MPITSEELAKRLIIAAQARRDIRRTTIALQKLGKEIIRRHKERPKKV